MYHLVVAIREIRTLVQLLHKLKIRAAGNSTMLLKVVKNPVTRHLPPGCKTYGESAEVQRVRVCVCVCVCLMVYDCFAWEGRKIGLWLRTSSLHHIPTPTSCVTRGHRFVKHGTLRDRLGCNSARDVGPCSKSSDHTAFGICSRCRRSKLHVQQKRRMLTAYRT